MWDSQSESVFKYLESDFMKPVISGRQKCCETLQINQLWLIAEVNYILNNLPIKVVVYNGQLALIVNILGTTKWVSKLEFPGADKFKASRKKILKNKNEVLGFYKTHDKFSFYWILNSGHFLAKDASDAALKMLLNILTWIQT